MSAFSLQRRLLREAPARVVLACIVVVTTTLLCTWIPALLERPGYAVVVQLAVFLVLMQAIRQIARALRSREKSKARQAGGYSTAVAYRLPPDDVHPPGDSTVASAASVIEQVAAEWLIRVDAQPSLDTWRALDRWLSANPRHRAAFLRQSLAWRRLDTLRQLRPLDGKIDPDLLTPAGYRTGEGKPDTVVLPDGSTMWLRSGSEIRVVAWQGGQRRLRLLYGEAIFRVRSHTSSLFEVEAFGTRIVATGTLFGVSVLGETASVEVRVASGQVEVRPTIELDDLSSMAPRTITPGLKATVSGSSVAVASAPIRETLRAFGWRLVRY